MCLLTHISPSLRPGLLAGSLTAIHMSSIPPPNWYIEEIYLTKDLNPSHSCTLTIHSTIYNMMNTVPRKHQQSLIMKPKEVSAPGIGRHFILHVCFKPALQMGLLNNQVVILSSTVQFDHHATDLAHTWHSATRGDIRQQDSLLPPCHMESRYNDSLKLELQLFHPRGNMLVSPGNCP